MPIHFDLLLAFLENPWSKFTKWHISNNKRGYIETIVGPARFVRIIDGLRTIFMRPALADINNEQTLDALLADLEDRGLLGWDRQTNRYDLHPIVRNIIWNMMGKRTKFKNHRNVQLYLQFSIARLESTKTHNFDDFMPIIEFYLTLIVQNRYLEAAAFFRKYLDTDLVDRFGVNRQYIELLEQLFPDGTDHPPRLFMKAAQAFIEHRLARGYQLNGQPGRALPLYRRHNLKRERAKDQDSLMIGLYDLSGILRAVGNLRESEASAMRSLRISRALVRRGKNDKFSLNHLGLTLAVRGVSNERQHMAQLESEVNASLAQQALWGNNHKRTLSLADRAWRLATGEQAGEHEAIRAARLQGSARYGLHNLDAADERAPAPRPHPR
jgi:hypothetical protein